MKGRSFDEIASALLKAQSLPTSQPKSLTERQIAKRDRRRAKAARRRARKLARLRGAARSTQKPGKKKRHHRHDAPQRPLAAPSGQKLAHWRYLRSSTWKKVRKRALAHYGSRCARAGVQCDGPLMVHHRTYERSGGDELMEDLEVLCRWHHHRVDAKHWKLSQHFRDKAFKKHHRERQEMAPHMPKIRAFEHDERLAMERFD